MGESSPLLTIVTRTFRRPRLLERCKASVQTLTSDDYEQVIIRDEKGVGYHGTCRLIFNAKSAGLLHGKYIWLLDDDDVLIDPNFVDNIRRLVKEKDNPPVIIVRMDAKGRVMPPDSLWKKAPVRGQIGGSCYVVRADTWEAYWRYLLTSRHAGDFKMVQAMYEAGIRFEWLDRVVMRVDRTGNEQPE